MKNNFKRIISAILLSSMAMPYAVSAKVANESISVSYNDIKLYLNDSKMTLTDASGNIIEPFVSSGTTYLPLRAVAEALSMNVGWDGETQTVSLTTDGQAPEIKELEYTPYIGQAEINIAYKDISVLLNSEKLTLKSADGNDIEPFIYNNTTYLPLRAVAEATNVTVEWDGETKSIFMISKPEEPKTESTYDLSLQSDWSKEKASAYGYTFEPTEDGQYTRITAYTGSETDILVPAKINGKTTLINTHNDKGTPNVFRENKQIVYASFEDGVYVENATCIFRDCSALEGIYNLKINTGLNCAFMNCVNLMYLDFGYNKSTSMYNLFHNCKKLRNEYDIPSGITSIERAYTNNAYVSKELYCYSTDITNANEAFKGVTNNVTLHVPYPSKSYDTLTSSELPENITIKKTENQIAYLPKEINVASFTTLNFYNYGVAPEYKDCTFTWKCDVGTSNENSFSVSGTEENVGSYPLSVTISKDGKEIYTAESTLNIISTKNLSKNMSLVTIGDHYVVYREWITRVNRNSQRIKFVGTRYSSLHEGRNSTTPEYYLKPFNYTSDKHGIGTDNPFLNPETQKFDWAYYNKYSGITSTAVQFTFQGTTSIKAEGSIPAMREMIDSILEVAPKTQIFITIPAYLANYTETNDLQLFNYSLALDEEFGDEENVHLVPLNLVYNRNKNVGKTKNLPDTEGYNSWGDAMYGAYAAVLQ